MKKIILLLFLLLTLGVYSQPKLVGALKYNGPQEGGSIFRLDLPGTAPGVVHTFNNLSPHRPAGNVSPGDADWLYGMLKFNGTNANGGLYRIKKDGSGFTMLDNISNPSGADMTPYYHSDGKIYFNNESQLKKFDPTTSLVTTIAFNSFVYTKNLLIDASDWMYFMTEVGVLAKMKTDGTEWTDLHNFDPATEGSSGIAGVTEVPGNKIFGVQTYGGTSGAGTLYSINKDGTAFTVHHQFTTPTGTYPESKLVLFDGKLYGTTTQGGDFGYGVLYTINEDGTGYRVLYHFEQGSFGPGEVPSGNIAVTSNGRIFGAFSQFAVFNFNYYRLFKVDTSGENFSPFLFLNQREQGHFNQGVVMTDDETIFFTTAEMGRHDGGVISTVDTSGTPTTLYQFGFSTNGFRPSAGLIKASNGKLYGTAAIGGTTGNGTIFSMNEDGTAYTKVHEFTDAEGYDLSGVLLEASDGKLYGACRSGGASNLGIIYRLDKNGSNFEIIHEFADFAEGYSPAGNLIEDASGKLYGTTFFTSPGFGTIFKMDRNGSNYSVLKTFDNTSELFNPHPGLKLSGNYLYGAASSGGAENKGGIFRIRTDGSDYEVLHTFAGATDGSTTFAPPMIASNGKLYGTTSSGGTTGEGTLFRMDLDGSNYSVLKNFSSTTDGSYPDGGLIQASDGLLYGTTDFATGGGGGIVYKINPDGSGFTSIRQFDISTEGQTPTSLLDLSGAFITLPVHLLTFTASKMDKLVLLNWQTDNENNSREFQVLRSADGLHFEAIGVVPATANSNSVISYSFRDKSPLPAINYYRLKQIDLDGKFEYSRIVPVQFTGIENFVVFPNPASDRLNVQLPKGNMTTTIIIVNEAGGTVLRKQIEGNPGVVELDIKHLSSGWYLVQLSGTTTLRERFFKN
jgi:uncharacterized repeat protein (TIGR03803 family)